MLDEEVMGEAVLSGGAASTAVLICSAGVVPTGAYNLRHHWLEEYEHRIFHDSPTWPRLLQQPEAEQRGNANSVETDTDI